MPNTPAKLEPVNEAQCAMETAMIAGSLSKFVEDQIKEGRASSGYPIFAAMGSVAAHYASQMKGDAPILQVRRDMVKTFKAGFDAFTTSLNKVKT